jgi:integrase
MVSGTKNHRGWGWIRKRASGRWQASFIGADNRRYFAPATFHTKMEAEEWLSRERRELDRARNAFERWSSPAERLAAVSAVNRETVAEYGARWIEQRNIGQRTQRHYAVILREHIIPALGDYSVGSLTPAIVRDWHARTLKDSPTMRAHAYGLLRAICNTAVKDELLERNPCQIDGAGKARTKRQLTVPEVDDVAVIAAKIDAKYRALVLLSAWCGCRFGEVSELRRRDLTDDASVLTIERGVTHHGPCNVSTPKSGKGRKVVVPPHIREMVLWHLETYVDPEPDALLFTPRRGGCHVSGRVVMDAFQKACATAGLANVRLHDLRHFAGTQVARAGNLKETMAYLGHSSVNAALIYQHVVNGRDVEIAEALSALAAKPKLAVVDDESTGSSA